MLQFRQPVNAQELEQIQRLRYRVYCQEKQFIDSSQYPDQRETDEYDQYATQFLFFDSATPDKLIGCFRIVLANPLGFPLESEFGFRLDHNIRQQTAEMSRLIIDPQYRGRGDEIFRAMIKTGYLFCRQHGARYFIAGVERYLWERFKQLGIVAEQILPGHWYMNGFVTPFYMDWVKTEAFYAETAPHYLHYLHARTPEHVWLPASKFSEVMAQPWTTARWSMTCEVYALTAA